MLIIIDLLTELPTRLITPLTLFCDYAIAQRIKHVVSGQVRATVHVHYKYLYVLLILTNDSQTVSRHSFHAFRLYSSLYRL